LLPFVVAFALPETVLLTATVLATSLALVLTASPEAATLWLQVDVGPESPCRVEALASAILVQRPDASLAMGKRPRDTDLAALLVESSGTLTLTVRGQGKPLSRALPPAGSTCQETLQTAALMIDRYLDELHASGEEARIEELRSASAPHLTLALGPSVVQAPFGLSVGLILEVDLRLGLLLLSLGGEANLSQSRTVTQTVQARTVQFTYDAQPAASWLAAGIAPRLGPGRFVAQASFGLSLLFVTAQSQALFQKRQGNAVDPYFGLRVAYAVDLPAQFSLALRYEERWVPSPTSFSVEGFAAAFPARRFSGDLALMAGYTFF
jgi:hypothetical protein